MSAKLTERKKSKGKSSLAELAKVSDFSFKASRLADGGGAGGGDDMDEDADLDSDVVDAIYAKMYFNAEENPQNQLKGLREQQQQQTRSGDLGGVAGAAEEDSAPNVWNVSLNLSPTEQGKGKSSSSTKRKKKSHSKHLNHVTKKPRLTDTADSSDMSDIIILDSYTQVIDLTAERDAAATPPDAVAADSKSPMVKAGKKKASRQKQVKGKKGLSKQKEVDSSSPEEDIKMLFSKETETPGTVILLSSGEEEDIDRSTSSVSGGSGRRSTLSGRGDSVEPVAGGLGSKGSSDMEVCSEGSAEEAVDDQDHWKINEKDRLGPEAYERLHGQGDSVGRYYGSRNTKCTNCRQRGHVAKGCPWPKRHTVCYLCAGLDHLSSSCPMSLCTYCYRQKHRGSSCFVPWASLSTTCTRCYMKGHHASICPDLWRQYHHTTYESQNLVISDLRRQRREDKAFCSNCSGRGHFGYECTRTTPRGNTAYHLPLIALYDRNVWPPRDVHSQQIIYAANKNRTPSKDSTPDSPGGRGKRPPAAEDVEEGEILPPDKRRSIGSSSGKNRRKRNSQNVRPERRTSTTDKSLIITVDGRSPLLGGRGPPSDCGPLLGGRGPPGDMYLPSRSSLLGTPPSGPQPYPREPHYHHTPYERDSYGRGNYTSNESQEWYGATPQAPPPHPRRRDTWHHDTPDHSSFSTLPPRDYREQLSRSLSTGEDHRHAHQHHRRYSEHSTRPSLHDTLPPLMDATPTYSDRGRMLSSNRGFRMSVQAAQGAGLYRGDRQSSSGHGSYSRGQYR